MNPLPPRPRRPRTPLPPAEGAFVAIDFETADHLPDSACAVGLVRVENKQIVARETVLIRPPRSRIIFTHIHGITWPMVAAAPAFGEVWAKLDAGTEAWYQRVNVSRVSLERVEANLIGLGREHPFKIQTLFCALGGETPPPAEIDAYLERLKRVRQSGADILEVQLHTVARKPAQSSVTPVEAAFLRGIAARIEADVAVPARVYGVED